MATRAKWYRNILQYFDNVSFETVRPFSPVVFFEDFLGKAFDVTNIWTANDTGAATQALVADGPSGAIELLLTNAVEIQLAGIDWGNQRTLTLNQGLQFEARLRFTTLPVNAITAVIGLAGDHNAAINTVAESIWFRWNFSGATTVETDDTTHETTSVATGSTWLVNIWHIVRIDCSDIEDVKFYIDGARVAAATTFNMHTVPALALQPVARLDKAADALNLGVMEVDYIKVWQNRS